ncbi:TPA: lipoyl(octanoyl) transferase LipB [Candidatus Peregrinibacteria bacterium]|nr:lipoyl(octanoyl) transferase LipB [Candidatus Peregrinibacteria bacterium]
MSTEWEYQDWGLIDYGLAWEKQRKLWNNVKESKFSSSDKKSKINYLIFCEHPHVYTLGKSGNNNNLLIPDSFLSKINAKYFHIDRGGDITYHGPGQIVGYPIIDLENFNLGIKSYIILLEETIIKFLSKYGIKAGRLDKATGVWLDADTANARKICAIGVKVSRWITMHGFAFNINTDLNYFSYINPCGFTDKGVTSMSKELGYRLDFEKIKQELVFEFEKTFGHEIKK